MSYKALVVFILFVIAIQPVFTAPNRVHDGLEIAVTLNVNKNVSTTVNNSTQINNNTGWSTSTSAVYNDTTGVNICIGCSTPLVKLDVRGSANVSGAINTTVLAIKGLLSCSATGFLTTDANGLVSCGASVGGGTVTSVGSTFPIKGGPITTTGNISFDNTSYDNLDARQRNDNLSIVRTDRTNFITGGINVTTFVNASELWALRINASLDCKYITGGSDADFCADQSGGGGSNGTANTDTVQSIGNDHRAWGNATLTGSTYITITQSAGLTNPTFTFDWTGQSISLPLLNITGRNGTALSNLVQSINITGQVRLWGNLSFDAQSPISITNTTEGLENTRLIWNFNNASYSNLDTRQRNDNQSVARTNVQNTFTESQFIQGNLNVTGMVNSTDVWVNRNITLRSPVQSNSSSFVVYASNGVCVRREFFNGTHWIQGPC